MSSASQAEILQDLPGLQQTLLQMLAQGQQEQMVAMVVGLLEQLLTKNTQLEWRLQAALRQLYRRKSEKISPDQLLLFLSKLDEAQAQQAQVETQPPEVPPGPEPGDTPPVPPKGKPPRPGRKPLPPHLRREVRTIEPTPEQLVCDNCGGPRSPWASRSERRWS